MSHTLLKLSRLLATSKDPAKVFRSYQGVDWKNTVIMNQFESQPHSKVLWENKNNKLVLTGWYPQQEMNHYNNYCVVHTMLLEGLLLSSIKLSSGKKLSLFLSDHRSYECYPPFVEYSSLALQSTCTLQLIQTSYLY